MKKSLLALAVLGAFAGTASAQSSVTLYGVADAWVGSSKSSTIDASGNLSGVRQTVQNSGGRNGSRWGLRGSEDLGGGLKANFQLESGFTIDDGNVANGATMFGRQAFVALAGGFGEVRLGRQYTAYDELRGGNNIVGDTSFSPTGDVWGQHSSALASGLAAAGLTPAQASTLTGMLATDYSNRVNNQIYYGSPNFSGVTFSLGYALGENKTAAVGTLGAQSSADTLSAKVQYAAGPLMVGFAHQSQRPRTTAASVNTLAAVLGGGPVYDASVPGVSPVNGDRIKFNLLSGSYDFGFAKLLANYSMVDRVGGLDDKEFNLGVDVPIGSLTARLGYAQAKGFDDAIKSKGFGAILDYSLSKRTNAYAGLRLTESKADDGPKFAKNQVFGVGLRHAF